MTLWPEFARDLREHVDAMEGETMFCMKCQNDFADCICADLQERLQRLADGPNSRVALAWCSKCDKHQSKCECDAPERCLRHRGVHVPLNSLSWTGGNRSDVDDDGYYDDDYDPNDPDWEDDDGDGEG